MALNAGFITWGVGPGDIADLILDGLTPAEAALLSGGETGYLYNTPTATEPTLVATPAAAAASLTVGPASSDNEYVYGPS